MAQINYFLFFISFCISFCQRYCFLHLVLYFFVFIAWSLWESETPQVYRLKPRHFYSLDKTGIKINQYFLRRCLVQACFFKKIYLSPLNAKNTSLVTRFDKDYIYLNEKPIASYLVHLVRLGRIYMISLYIRLGMEMYQIMSKAYLVGLLTRPWL